MSVTPEDLDAKRQRIAELTRQIEEAQLRRTRKVEEDRLAAEATALDNEIARLESELARENAANEGMGLVTIEQPSPVVVNTPAEGDEDVPDGYVPAQVPVAPGAPPLTTPDTDADETSSEAVEDDTDREDI